MMMTKAFEWRLKRNTPMRCLAIAEGYAMVRFKGCQVHVIDANEWRNLPLCDTNGAAQPKDTQP